MKLKFILFAILLLFARGCDFYSTSLWFFQKNGIDDEMNPLTLLFGVGWNGLIITNIIIVGIILGMGFYYYFRYKPTTNFSEKPRNYKEYASLLYFGVPNKFHQLLYKFPSNKNAVIAHTGYVLIRVIILASFLATFHNLGQYYRCEWYNDFRILVERPVFFIYGTILISFGLIYFQLIKKEYQEYLVKSS